MGIYSEIMGKILQILSQNGEKGATPQSSVPTNPRAVVKSRRPVIPGYTGQGTNPQSHQPSFINLPIVEALKTNKNHQVGNPSMKLVYVSTYIYVYIYTYIYI